MILTILSTLVIAQTIDEQKEYADSLFKVENYFDAITEYKRLLFFDRSDKFEYQANMNIALSYKAGAKYEDAIKYLSVAQRNCDSDSIFIATELEIIRINILRRTIPEALKELDELQSKYPGQFAFKKIEIVFTYLCEFFFINHVLRP